jgi:hypothetical protein
MSVLALKDYSIIKYDKNTTVRTTVTYQVPQLYPQDLTNRIIMYAYLKFLCV